MGDVGLRRLYMAKSLEELNKQVQEIPRATAKL